jgi:glycosyltransferase involved in cell wall biosynthesis
VDNASTDRTKEVVQSCHIPAMSVRYIYEPKRGKSNAYNTAFGLAEGSILISTDDDVRFTRNWITEITQPIIDGNGDAVAGSITIAEHLQRPLDG